MPRAIPDFIIIGAMKCGTTSFFRYLKKHPGVFMSEIKEPNFYIENRNWSKGFDWYRSLYADAPPGALLGEASTNYSKGTTFPGVPKLLAEHVPDVRLIYLLRDPLERIRSHYKHAVFHGRARKPPQQAIRVKSGYVRTSLYGAELRRYRQYFSADQILVLLTEDLRDDPAAVLRRTEQFLGLSAHDYKQLEKHYHVSDNRRVNSRLGDAVQRRQRLAEWSKRAMPEQLHDRLLTRPIGPSDDDSLPPEVIERIRPVLAADRRLLLSQVDLDLAKWAQLVPGRGQMINS